VGSVGNAVITATSKNARAKLISLRVPQSLLFWQVTKTSKKVSSLATGRKTILAVKSANFVKDVTEVEPEGFRRLCTGVRITGF
jgi:hypothetical protein